MTLFEIFVTLVFNLWELSLGIMNIITWYLVNYYFMCRTGNNVLDKFKFCQLKTGNLRRVCDKNRMDWT